MTEANSFTIAVNTEFPGSSLIAYLADNAVNVKRIADHYVDDASAYLAEKRALSFLYAGQQTDESPEAELNSCLAEMVFLNAAAELHRVNRRAFVKMTQAMYRANPDPVALHHAASDAVLHGHSGLELLLSLPHVPMPAVDAALSAGIDPGIFRALCATMGADYSDYGVEPPQVDIKHVIAALDACLTNLHPHQVMTIAETFGADRHQHPAINQ